MEILNAFSTAIIAVATVVTTWTTWRLASIERNREIASNGIFAWVTPDHFFVMIDEESYGNRSLKLNARSSSNLPAYEVKIEVLLDKQLPEFQTLAKGTVFYSKHIPVLFENSNEMTPEFIEPAEITNLELREFLSSNNHDEKFGKVYAKLAIHTRTRISFRDVNGVAWTRDINGKLKSLL